MLKELAVIKDRKDIIGFVVYDGLLTRIMPLKEMEKEAAAGYVDTLDFRDGAFVPILQGELADEFRKRGRGVLRRAKKRTASMDFGMFVDNDCIFRNRDVQLALAFPDVVLANVCIASAFRIQDVCGWNLTMAFWCMDPHSADILRDTFDRYADIGVRSMRNRKDCGGFLMLNLPLTDARHGFDLLTLQEETGLKFLYNLDMIENMQDRTRFMADNAPFLMRGIMRRMVPDDKSLAGLKGVLREANRISMKRLGLSMEADGTNHKSAFL